MSANNFEKKLTQAVNSIVRWGALLVKKCQKKSHEVFVYCDLAQDVAKTLSGELAHISVFVLKKFDVDSEDCADILFYRLDEILEGEREQLEDFVHRIQVVYI